MPCSDAHSKASSTAQINIEQSNHDHHNIDICSPFCVCSSCTVAIILQPAITFEPPHFEEYNKETVSFYKSENSSFYGSIWQPPQLI